MAMAKKCDRCSGYYETYREKKRLANGVNGVGFVLINSDGSWRGCREDAFDLCPNCLNAVADFVLGKEKRG